jgi:hypothetical protein
MHLVLEAGAVSAAFGGNNVLVKTIWNAGLHGYWWPTDALQGSRLG